MSGKILTIPTGLVEQASQELFVTTEQAAARADDSLQGYWRLDDPLCAKFLSIGRDPAHFLPLRAFFPFIREASVLQMPKVPELLPRWLSLAFNAGFLFGKHLPEEAKELLDYNTWETREALRRLRILRDSCGECRSAVINPFHVFRDICKVQWNALKAEEMMDMLAETSFNAFKAGLAAIPFAANDLVLMEFIEAINPATANPGMPLTWQTLTWSPLVAHHRPVFDRLAHPLLKLVAMHYPVTPRERETILPFFTEQLSALRPLSENQCPTEGKAVEEWLRNALEYGGRIKTQQPQRIAEIVAEVGEDSLRTTKDAVRSLVSSAGGTEAGALVNGILGWHKKTWEWHSSGFYGQDMERLVYCTDFAIWFSWLWERS